MIRIQVTKERRRVGEVGNQALPDDRPISTYEHRSAVRVMLVQPLQGGALVRGMGNEDRFQEQHSDHES